MNLETIIVTANILILISFGLAMEEIKNVLRFILCLEIITFAVGVICTCITMAFSTSSGIITACILLVCAAAETAVLLALVVRNYRKKEAIELNDYRELRG